VLDLVALLRTNLNRKQSLAVVKAKKNRVLKCNSKFVQLGWTLVAYAPVVGAFD
jgi:hypothetical protein